MEEKIQPKQSKELTYKDEQGQKLYGFSQLSLDKNTLWLKLLVLVIFCLLLYILWLTYYVISNNVINNVVARCIC